MRVVGVTTDEISAMSILLIVALADIPPLSIRHGDCFIIVFIVRGIPL